MKSPTELQTKLRNQWDNAELRESRLLSSTAWPVPLSIGLPSATTIKQNMPALRAHLKSWRTVQTGKVEWKSISYRDTSDPIDIPVVWQINTPSEWITACDDARIDGEFKALERIIRNSDSLFHSTILRQRSQVLSRSPEEVILICQVAMELKEGYAEGKPLRALSICGCDTKFIERNHHLITTLVALRYGEQVKDLGLEKFLKAEDGDNHWLLVVPLAPNVLPFKQLRLQASELRKTSLPCKNILIVENEHCLYQLPEIEDTIAIFGAGLNLSWMQSEWLSSRNIGYWGDMDTWGLNMLATARSYQDHLIPLMMNRETFERFRSYAVEELSPYSEEPPSNLTIEEREFYQFLFSLEKGRLEQEFLPIAYVHEQFQLIK